MKNIIPLLFLVLAAIVVVAQPFTPSELAWPKGKAKGTNAPPDCSGIGATNSLTIISENTPSTIIMHGAGGAFAVLADPSFGTLSAFDSVAGTALYTPNTDYVGPDSFTFTVQNGVCSTNATVYISVLDTNSGSPVCATVSGVSPLDITTTVCWTMDTNGVVVSSGCDEEHLTLPGFFSGELCAWIVLCDVTNTINQLGYDPVSNMFFAPTDGNLTNWLVTTGSRGPAGVCGDSVGNYFFCNPTASTNLHIVGQVDPNIGTGGSFQSYLYYGTRLITNLSTSSSFTFTADVKIPASNKVVITISNYMCNAGPHLWITNTLLP